MAIDTIGLAVEVLRRPEGRSPVEKGSEWCKGGYDRADDVVRRV